MLAWVGNCDLTSSLYSFIAIAQLLHGHDHLLQCASWVGEAITFVKALHLLRCCRSEMPVIPLLVANILNQLLLHVPRLF